MSSSGCALFGTLPRQSPFPLGIAVFQLVSVSASPLQSISASAQSWSSLYRAWSSGSFTRSLLRDYADPQTVEQYLSQASVSTSSCSLRTITSACTVFSSESKLASHGVDHQVEASPHVPSVKTTVGADASPGYVASPARVAPAGRSTSSSSLLFLSPPSPFLVSPGRSRPCRRRNKPLASLRQRGNDGGKAVASGAGIAVASGRGLVRLRFLFILFVGRPFYKCLLSPSFTRTGRIDRFSEFPRCPGFHRSV